MKVGEKTMQIGEKIKQLRINKGMKGKELAQLSKLDPSQISKIEKGDTNPSLEALERICNALDVTLSEFFSNCNGKSKSNREIQVSAFNIDEEVNEEIGKLLKNSKYLTEKELKLLNEILQVVIKRKD